MKDTPEKLQKVLNELYQHLESIKIETIKILGEKQSLHILDFHANNWIDIRNWITSEHKKDTENSLLFFYFFTLFKKVYWMQLFFLSANYSAIYKDLRYIWELISQGYYIDSRCSKNMSLDQRMGLAQQLEEEKYGWKLVKDVLKDLGFNDNDIKIIHQLWIYLNKHAHPSPKQFNEIAREDFSIFVTDSFNKNLAISLLRKIDCVFDIIYLILLREFSGAIKHAKKYKFLDEWKEYIPLIHSLVVREK